MRRLKKFNESNIFHEKEDIIKFVSEIRECCLEFEDDNKIFYNFSVAGSDLSIYFSPDDNSKLGFYDFDEWIDKVYSYVKDSSEFCLSLNFTITERKVYRGRFYLTSEGINKLEDIITIKRRLEYDFDIIMQMDRDHTILKIFYPEF